MHRFNESCLTVLDDDRLPADALPNDPTPAEIRRACLSIQRTWSDEERALRAAGMLRELQRCRGRRHQANGLHGHPGTKLSDDGIPENREKAKRSILNLPGGFLIRDHL